MLSQILSISATIVRPPPDLFPDEYADRYRILPPESAEPGRWRTARTPYMIPIMRAFQNPRIRTIVACMGSQMGKTESLFNCIFQQLDHAPVPALYVGPTEKNVRSISENRIKKAIQSIPSLWNKTSKGNRLKITEYYIAGVRFGMAWAGSATELSSHPAGTVLVDEVDRFDNDTGGEGDPVTLARARTKTYANAKIVITSTPTIEGASAVWSHYEAGTMGKWAVPCPHCETAFIPKLEFLIWPEKATPQQAFEAARLVCPACGCEIENKHKTKMNEKGEFIWHSLDENGKHIPTENNEIPNTRTMSFWVSGLMSPWQTFGEIAEIMVQAYRKGDPETIQAAVNTYAGELYRTRGDAPKMEEIRGLIRQVEPRQIPPGVQLITAGVDVQKNGLYYVVKGWMFNTGAHTIDAGFIPGETEFDNVWLLLNRLLEPGYLPNNQHIERMFVDSGYRPGDKLKRPEHQVYKYSRLWPGRVFPTKGHDAQDRPVKMSLLDISVGGRVIKNGIRLWHLNTDYLKTFVHSRLRFPAGEAGEWTFHSKTDDDYLKQLTSEEVITKASGRRIWVMTYRDNHYLDCETNALAAALTLQVQTLKPPAPEPPKAKPPTSEQKTPFIKTGPGPFIRR